MLATRVFSGDSRSPSGASTASTCGRSSSACRRSPATMTTKSSAKRISRQLPSPFLLRALRRPLLPISCCHCRAKCSSSADRAILARSGESTPPTQWATGRLVTLRVGVGRFLVAGGAFPDGDAVPDGDLLGSDEDVLDQQPQHALAFGDARALGVAAELGEEAFQVVGELEVGLAVGELGIEGGGLAAQVRFAGSQGGHPGAQLVDGDQLFLERLDHPGDRGRSLGELKLQPFVLPGGRVACAGLLE